MFGQICIFWTRANSAIRKGRATHILNLRRAETGSNADKRVVCRPDLSRLSSISAMHICAHLLVLHVCPRVVSAATLWEVSTSAQRHCRSRLNQLSFCLVCEGATDWRSFYTTPFKCSHWCRRRQVLITRRHKFRRSQRQPIAVAERSRARTVFARSNTAIVGSNPT
jgi:hypothetical protein